MRSYIILTSRSYDAHTTTTGTGTETKRLGSIFKILILHSLSTWNSTVVRFRLPRNISRTDSISLSLTLKCTYSTVVHRLKFKWIL